MAGMIDVIVNIYSGRRNPTIDLSAKEIEELRRRWELALREPAREGREPPQLGYRGFVIYNRIREAGLPYRAQIFGGFVAVTDEPAEPKQRSVPQKRFFRDAGDIEGWLWDRAADRSLTKSIIEMGAPDRGRAGTP